MDTLPPPTPPAPACVAYQNLPEPTFLNDVPNYIVGRIIEAHRGHAWTLTTERFALQPAGTDANQAATTPGQTAVIQADECGRLRAWRTVVPKGIDEFWERSYQQETVTQVEKRLPYPTVRRAFSFDASRRIASETVDGPLERGRWDYRYTDLPGGALLQEGTWTATGRTPTRVYYRAFAANGKMLAQGDAIDRDGMKEPDPVRWWESGTVYQLDASGRSMGHVDVKGGRALTTVRYKKNSEGAWDMRGGFQFRYRCRLQQPLFCSEEDIEAFGEGPDGAPVSDRFVRRLSIE